MSRQTYTEVLDEIVVISDKEIIRDMRFKRCLIKIEGEAELVDNCSFKKCVFDSERGAMIIGGIPCLAKTISNSLFTENSTPKSLMYEFLKW